MAASDYNVADRNISGGITAADKLAETDRGENPDVDARERADAAGVSNAAYIGYAEALEAFEARDDIEPLAVRRAREYGSDFDAGSIMRQAAYEDDGTAADAPRPGTVFGDAPKES
jgi:hypothetical protein